MTTPLDAASAAAAAAADAGPQQQPQQPRADPAELIGAALARLTKACGRDRKLAPVADAAKDLQDRLAEVLRPGYGDEAAQQASSTSADDPAAAVARQGSTAARALAHAAKHASPDALSDAAATEVLRVLRLAVDTARPPLVEVALDLLHRLIALRLLVGAAHSAGADHHHHNQQQQQQVESAAADKTAAEAGVAAAAPAAPAAPAAARLDPPSAAVELICRCDEVPDEGVEVLVLRGLLTAAASPTFVMHGQALLLAVRTCYNIHLMSRSEVNQTTAKATLTQMLNVVFQRMEAGSVAVAVRPIVVADMLSGRGGAGAGGGGAAGGGAGGGGAGDPAGVAPTVQSFVNSVIGMTGLGPAAAQQSAETLRSSVAAQFSAHPSPSSGPLPADGPAPPELRLAGDAAPAAPASAVEMAASAEQQQQGEGGDQAPAGTATAGSATTDDDDDDDERFELNAVRADEADAAGAAAAAAQGPKLGGDSAGKGIAAAAAAQPQPPQSPEAALLARDAFLVFRALCKLSVRTGDAATVQDPTAVRGKLLALELLKVLLENSGPMFRSSERFLAAIRQYLCLSLLKNAASSIPAALSLVASIFLSLLQRFRGGLKAEVGVFFPAVLLRPLEPAGAGAGGAGGAAATSGGPAANSYSYKVVVLRCLREVCADGQLLVDLFVNYDCDLGSSNLFERLVSGLVKMAQAPLPTNGDHAAVQQEQWLRQEALQCVSSTAESLLAWYNRAARGQPPECGAGNGDAESDAGDDDVAALAAAGDAASAARPGTPRSGVDGGGSEAEGNTTDRTSGTGGGGGGATGGDALSRKRAMKEKWAEGVALFNRKPKRGIALLQAEGMLGVTPEHVAEFLATTEGLDKTLIGDYLGEREDTALKVMHAYVDRLDFAGMEFDAAIRAFLRGFRLPGEAQKIDRLMEKFAARYLACNPGSFKSADVAYVLAYSVIMLNTDAHNPQVKNKMTCDGFIRNNRGINDGADLPADFMRALYERIVTNEIKMKDEAEGGGAGGGGAAGDGAEQGGAAAAALLALRNNAVMNALWSIVGGHRPSASSEPSDEAIRRTLDSLHARAKGATFVAAREPDTVRPMLELVWAPLLGALSLLFDEYSDPRLVSICLSGYGAAACLAAVLGVAAVRDAFVTGLNNFAGLHAPGGLRPKNALAFRALLRVAVTTGDGLEGRWLDVLRSISRWELLQQLASGMPTDAALFGGGGAGAGAGGGKGGRGAKATAAPQQQQQQQSMETLAMSEAAIKRAAGGLGDDGRHHHAPPGAAEVLRAVDASEVQAVYLSSAGLDPDGVVAFVRALAATSSDELRDAGAPRVFSLTKIVEVAHFNMGRIRLVWGRIWAVLSEHFIAASCHPNLGVAMYAVDSLRQLAAKFLERDELTAFTFQTDFLRPFVVAMRQSQSVEIRELIVRCVSQMVLSRAASIRSGWKSVFMVLATAAGDADPSVVRLAFDTLERVVRDDFDAITAAEAATFTDAVNCLVAFTGNAHSPAIALAAVGHLKEAAARLAGGEAAAAASHDGGGGAALDAATPAAAAAAAATAADDALAAGWFPLLAGLSELAFDPRREMRHAALEVLFDVLRSHGGAFAEAFWCRVFERVLLPIFDAVRAEVTDAGGGALPAPAEARRQREDAWLYETCTRCLQHLVDLFGLFYPRLRPVLPRLLGLLSGLMARSHAALAAVGAAALSRLVADCGGRMDAATWREVGAALVGVVDATQPDVAALVTPPAVHGAGSGGFAAAVESPAARRSGSGIPNDPFQQQQQQLGGGGGDGSSSGACTTPRAPYTLREGIGARRLARFRVHAGVQLLLVQAVGETYARHHARLPPDVVAALLCALSSIAANARAANTDAALRRRLAARQCDDRVPEDRCAADPPLLRQETEAMHAQLSVLLHLTRGGGSASAAAECGAQQQLEQLTIAVLDRFSGGGGGGGAPDPAEQQQQAGAKPAAVAAAAPGELAAFAPLAASTLRALSAADEARFRASLPALFPALARSAAAGHAAPDAQRALSDLLLSRVGPLLGAPAPVRP